MTDEKQNEINGLKKNKRFLQMDQKKKGSSREKVGLLENEDGKKK